MEDRREDKNKLLKNLWLVNRRLGGLDVCVSAVHANVNACICAFFFYSISYYIHVQIPPVILSCIHLH